MGAKLSDMKESARVKTDTMREELEQIERTLRAKLEMAQSKLLLMRLHPAGTRDIGAAGRVASRMVMMQATASTEANKEIMNGINTFVSALEGGGKDPDPAKSKNGTAAVVKGLGQLLSGVLNGLLGAQEGTSSEISNFTVLFVNMAFVRIDYYCYYYRCSAQSTLYSAMEGGFCSLSEVSIIPVASLTDEQITFFLAQSLLVSDASDEMYVIQVLKLLLMELAVLSRQLKKPLALEDIQVLRDNIYACHEQLQATWETLPAISNAELDTPNLDQDINRAVTTSGSSTSASTAAIAAATAASTAGKTVTTAPSPAIGK